MRFTVIAILLSPIVLGLAAPVRAQGEARDWQICANASRSFTPQRQSQACSAVLRAGGLSAPMLGFALYNRGNAMLALGDYVTAVEDYDHSVEANPSDPNVFKARCWALSVIGRLDEALADCTASLDLQPAQDDTLETRGLIHLRQGNFVRARRDFDNALQINARLPGSLFGRGIAELRLGDGDRATADLAAARAMRRDIDAQFARFGLRP